MYLSSSDFKPLGSKIAYFTFLSFVDLVFLFTFVSVDPSSEKGSLKEEILLFLKTITESLESSGTGSGGGIFSNGFDSVSSKVS